MRLSAMNRPIAAQPDPPSVDDQTAREHEALLQQSLLNNLNGA
jgi:hypothetical protein